MGAGVGDALGRRRRQVYRHAGFTFHLVGVDVLYRPVAAEVYQHVPADMGLGSLAARYLGRYGRWVTGFLHAVSAVCPPGGLYQWRR
ncbi:hypothetical protein LNP25_28900 [Klebsiella variicola subsp. variicola]|nr:hypothetical protein [Klebsiella variicola subsp. variicola]